MTKLKHYDDLGTARFVTFSCYHQLPSLNHPRAKEILIDEIDRARAKHGFKLCPCRLRDGTRQRDLELICPCNFKTHETWLRPKNKAPRMCWCGLFIKKEEVKE